MWTNKYDPLFFCQPLGIPRAGPPARILQTANDVVFLYAAGGGGAGNARVPHHPDRRPEARSGEGPGRVLLGPLGRALGRRHARHRLGRVQRLDVARQGRLLHSDKKRVIERFTRKGNTLVYEVTVEDPDVLAEPWVMAPRPLRLNPNKDAGLLPEATPCRDYDHANMVTQIRH